MATGNLKISHTRKKMRTINNILKSEKTKLEIINKWFWDKGLRIANKHCLRALLSQKLAPYTYIVNTFLKTAV